MAQDAFPITHTLTIVEPCFIKNCTVNKSGQYFHTKEMVSIVILKQDYYRYTYMYVQIINNVCIISLTTSSTPATPADVALLMQLGVDGVFVGSGIFKSANPSKRAKAMVQAVTHYNDPKILAQISEDLGEPMVS